MTDYYPLVRRAVADVEENTGETRLALLQRVRTVLVNELRSLTPPLTESEIAREQVSLEEAIRKVEAEMMDRIQDERPRPPLAAPRELPLPEQERAVRRPGGRLSERQSADRRGEPSHIAIRLAACEMEFGRIPKTVIASPHR
jgi:hypothetical protein